MNYKIDRGWLFTEFSCENADLKEIGITVQTWLPAAIKMDSIVGFKIYQGITEGKVDAEEGKVIVYTEGNTFYLNIDYDEFVKLFTQRVK